jgi:hypothetical protein
MIESMGGIAALVALGIVWLFEQRTKHRPTQATDLSSPAHDHERG